MSLFSVIRLKWPVFLALLAASAVLATAPAYSNPLRPNAPVRIIVSHPAGGTADTAARILARALSQSIDRVVVIDNRNGAGGALGLSLAAQASTDGNTLVLATSSHAIITAAAAMPTANLSRDFRSVSKIGSSAYILVASSRLPGDIRSVLAAPTASVRTIGFSGAATQLWAAVLQGTHRPELTLVNFSAPGQVPAAAAQGEIDLSVTSILTGLTWVQQGRVQPLLTTGQRRSGRAPTVATARELGFPELEAASWYGIVVPIQTNDAVVNYWNQEIRRVLTNKSVLEEYQNLEIHIDPGTPMDFSKFMSREIQRWQQTMVQSGIKIGF